MDKCRLDRQTLQCAKNLDYALERVHMRGGRWAMPIWFTAWCDRIGKERTLGIALSRGWVFEGAVITSWRKVSG